MRFASIRRLLFQVHMWIGLVLGLILGLIGLSGSVLVYDDEIMAFLNPAPRAEAVGAPAPLDKLAAAARQAAGGRRGPVQITLPDSAGEAALVRIGQFSRMQMGAARGPAPVDVFVDPVSAKVLGQRTPTPVPWLGFAHQLHGNFLMGRQGRIFIGWMGVAMLMLGVSGLVLWWPKRGQWKYAFIVRRTAKGLRFHRELHAAAGIWTFIVFMIVSFSGVAIVFPQTVNAMAGGAPMREQGGPGPRGGMVTVEPLDGAKPIGAGEAVKLALAAVPGAELRGITLPARRDQAIMVNLLNHGAINAGVVIDPWRAKVIGVRDPSETFIGWQRPLHQGTVGPVWRFLVFLSGFLPALFVITGVVMWAKKRKARIAMTAPLTEVSSS